jgi:hypothetical protein
MTIVVGYVPTPEGEAALTQAIHEARKSNTRLLVINSSKGDALVDNRYAQEPDIQSIEDRLATQGIDHVIKQPVRGHDAAAEVLAGLRWASSSWAASHSGSCWRRTAPSWR